MGTCQHLVCTVALQGTQSPCAAVKSPLTCVLCVLCAVVDGCGCGLGRALVGVIGSWPSALNAQNFSFPYDKCIHALYIVLVIPKIMSVNARSSNQCLVDAP